MREPGRHAEKGQGQGPIGRNDADQPAAYESMPVSGADVSHDVATEKEEHVDAEDADLVDAAQGESGVKEDDRQRGVGAQPLEDVDANGRLSQGNTPSSFCETMNDCVHDRSWGAIPTV